jgi:hypothetical protein
VAVLRGLVQWRVVYNSFDQFVDDASKLNKAAPKFMPQLNCSGTVFNQVVYSAGDLPSCASNK